MNNLPVKFVNGTIPPGVCFNNEQERLNYFTSLLGGYLPSNFILWNYGPDEPDPDNRGLPWLRLNVDGSMDRVYVYFNGQWVSPYRIPSDSLERMIWTGSTGDLQTYDGGNANAVDYANGPFWEVDHDFDFRMPIGAGTSPAPYSTTIAVGATGGAEKVVLDTNQMPAHTHEVDVPFIAGNNANVNSEIGVYKPASGHTTLTSKTAGGDDDGNTVAHQNLPPYRAIYMCKRTSRVAWTPS